MNDDFEWAWLIPVMIGLAFLLTYGTLEYRP